MGVIALGLAIAYWTRRKRVYFIGFGVVVALGCLAEMIAILIVTDNEQIQVNLQAMARGVSARDTEAIFKHVANDFHIAGTDKAGLKALAERVLHDGELTEVVMWDFDRADISASGSSATISFMVKPKGNRNPQDTFFRCNAAFVREADGKWRLKGFELHEPVNNQPLIIPDVQR